MKIDMENTPATMQEVVDLTSLVILNLAHLLKNDSDAHELLDRLCDNLDTQVRREREPRLRAMIDGVANYLHSGDDHPVGRVNRRD